MRSSEVLRSCDGSRFCGFTAVFYRQRLAALEPERPAIIGGCWFESFDDPGKPSRFVCNRCAHRTLAYDARTRPAVRLWLLLCPFCGQPLGQPDALTLLFDGEWNAMGSVETLTPDDIAAVLEQQREAR